jgi:hypothetical protein
VGDASIMIEVFCRSLPLGCRLMALGLALVLSTACVVGFDTRGYLQHDRRQFDIEESAHVSLSTFDGSIEVHGWDRALVEVNIEKRAASKELVESIEIAATQQGDQIRIQAKPPKSGTWETNVLRGSGMSAKLVAYVPVNSHVTVDTADGSVAVERLNGVVELRTLDGSVIGVDLSGSLRVSTGDGSVRLESVAGAVDVKTLDGSIVFSGRPEALKLLSSDGSVVVRIGEGVPMATDWEINTFDGGVELHLPSTFDALIDARTEDGRVSSDAMVAESGGERSRRELLGRMGAGGHTIKIRTGDGRISVRAS